jgi:hypothetical protein
MAARLSSPRERARSVVYRACRHRDERDAEGDHPGNSVTMPIRRRRLLGVATVFSITA